MSDDKINRLAARMINRTNRSIVNTILKDHPPIFKLIEDYFK